MEAQRMKPTASPGRPRPAPSLALLLATLLAHSGLSALASASPAGDRNQVPEQAGRTVAFEEVGQIGGSVTALDGAGERLFVGIGPRLGIFSLTDPDAPALIATSVSRDSAIVDLQHRDGFVYVNFGDRLSIFAVADDSPTMVASVSFPGEFFTTLDTVPGRVYMASRGGNMVSVNVAHPHQPSVERRYPLPGMAHRLQVAEGMAFLAIGSTSLPRSGGIYALDLGSGVMRLSIPFENRAVTEIFTVDAVLYASTGDELIVIDIRDLKHPVELQRVADSYSRIWRHGEFLLAKHYADLHIFHRSQDGRLELAGTSERAHLGRDLWSRSDRGYVGSYFGEVSTLDLSLPFRPRILNLWESVGGVLSVAVSDGIAYLRGNADRLHAVDVSDPRAPRHLWTLRASVYGRSIAAEHGLLCVPAIEYSDPNEDNVVFISHGVHVFDIQNPFRPQLASTIMPIDSAGFDDLLELRDGVLYVSGGQRSLELFDLEDPTNPQPLSRVEVGYSPIRMLVHDDLAYVTSGTDGINPGSLLSLDLSDPRKPKVLRKLEFAGFPSIWALAIDDPRLLASGYVGPLWFDVSNPRAMAVVEGPGFDLLGRMDSTRFIEPGLLLGRRETGPASVEFVATDLANPLTPRSAGGFSSYVGGIGLMEMAQTGQTLIVPNGGLGLRIMRYAVSGEAPPTPAVIPTRATPGLPSPAPSATLAVSDRAFLPLLKRD